MHGEESSQRIAPSKMLPSENRRAICDVTMPEASPGPEESDIVTAHARREYLKAIHGRYRQAPRPEKRQILDECCRGTGYHRKHAVRLLNGAAPSGDHPRTRRRRPPTYGLAGLEAGSEEGRVGEEGRSRWWADHLKKKK